jgi:tetratricopeptide (TPR) repeat protein
MLRLLSLLCLATFALLGAENDDAEFLFQMAEKHQNNGQYEDAIHWYKLRLEKGGQKEQLWMSKYRMGQCYEALNEWHEALYWYLEAHQNNPGFLDPLLNIAMHYRIQGENDLAYIFAKHGSRFLPTHDYQFEQELSIVSFYTRFKEDGYKAASDLLIRKDVPWHVKDQTYRNILYYSQNLKNTRFQPIDIDLPLIVEGNDERYHPMNPSILKTEDGFKLICRSVNYTQTGAKHFYPIDPDGYVRTRNFLVNYTKDFKVISSEEIIEDLPRQRLPYCNVLGLEDPRIFEFQKSLWFTCSSRDNTLDGTPQISLCKMDSNAKVESMVLLHGPDPLRCEKNWLPFVHDGAFYAIYSYDPFIIYKPDMETGQCELEISYEPIQDFTQFRGSAGPIPLDDGYLVLIHEIVHFPDQTRCYLHRFLYLDHRFYVKQISKPFTFLHQGVEFCGSMTFNHEGTHLVLPIGIEDNKAYLCFVDLKTVRSLLTSLQPSL